MFRLTMTCRALLVLLIINCSFFLYLFLRRQSKNISIVDDQIYDQNNYQCLNNDHRTSISKVLPIPRYFDIENATLPIYNGFRIVSLNADVKESSDLKSAIRRYAKYISVLTGIAIDSDLKAFSPENALSIDSPSIDAEKTEYPNLDEDESYTLNITSKGSRLYASTLTGIVRGLATFVQLIELNSTSENNIHLPQVHIVDRPRFIWRGLMLDVSRHWMPVAIIERTLNKMELSKLNVLHLHLSDDQGFRVESRRYKLLHDRHLFYTQKQIKYLVEYARQRRIRIVPEFDIPGHTTSWFVGYPKLASAPGPYQVESRWGVMKPTMDPTRNSTYTFLNEFFAEMTELFPDPYFHIGGDEVEGSQWSESASIQSFIKEHKLENNAGLQAYFTRHIQKLLKKYGKTMIGWEEILDEKVKISIERDAIIQSWKNRRSLFEAIDKGHRALLSYGYYLDHLSSTTFHYKINPIINDELWLFNEEQLNNILGGEACMWTECVSETNIDSRIWPRLLAIAERFWSSSTITDEASLRARLDRTQHLFDKLHRSTYISRLRNLILDKTKQIDLLHPFAILADVCEPLGYQKRFEARTYTSEIPLTTFVDALQSESELVWKMEYLPINYDHFHAVFQTWSLNHLRLRRLFDDNDTPNQNRIWQQDVKKLSQNLAETGRLGLQLLTYGKKRTIVTDDQNGIVQKPALSVWTAHLSRLLDKLENEVAEVRLAAVQPVRRLLKSIEVFV